MHRFSQTSLLPRRQFLGAAAALLGAATAGAQTAGNPFVFGMVPYLPVQQLVRLYEPLVAQLERSLGRKGRLASSADFEQFIERARAGEFDVVGASPHVARLLQREEGFIPLARATAPLEPVFVVPIESALKTFADLQGSSLLVADPFAVHVLIALRALRDAGIVPGQAVRLIVAGRSAMRCSGCSRGMLPLQWARHPPWALCRLTSALESVCWRARRADSPRWRL